MKNFNLNADNIRCKKCRNSCCMMDGAYYHPEDFDDIVSEVVSLIVNGLAHTTRSYYGLVVAPTRVQIGYGKYGIGIYKCVYLASFGCIIPAEKRPHACRHYGPTSIGKRGKLNNCEGLFYYKDYVEAWEPYIDEIVEKVQQQGIWCLT